MRVSSRATKVHYYGRTCHLGYHCSAFSHLYGIFHGEKMPLRRLNSNQDAWLGLARPAAKLPGVLLRPEGQLATLCLPPPQPFVDSKKRHCPRSPPSQDETWPTSFSSSVSRLITVSLFLFFFLTSPSIDNASLAAAMRQPHVPHCYLHLRILLLS
jgi:hypothetical protein